MRTSLRWPAGGRGKAPAVWSRCPAYSAGSGGDWKLIRRAGVVDGAVHLPHRHEDPLAGFDWRVDVSLPHGAAALQHHDHVFRFVVQVLGELLARLVQPVVEGEPARAHFRVHDAPVAALAHAEGAARIQVEQLHQAGLAAVSANSDVVQVPGLAGS